VVLNVGAQDGVIPGMRFGIWTPREHIVDPETSEDLGTYRLRKANVVAKSVSQRFTVASAAPITRRTGTAFQGSLAAIVGQVEEVEVDLPVDPGQLQPLGASQLLTVGDTAEEIVPARAASQQSAIPKGPSPTVAAAPTTDPTPDPPATP